MRVAVTGASGFVGHAVLHRLAHTEHQVAVLARADLHPSRLREVVADADAVIHLAALARVRDSHQRPLEYFAANTGLTLELLSVLDRARQNRGVVPRLVFASTAAVYGIPLEPQISEAAPLAPTSPYGASKAAAEAAIDWQAKTGNLAAATLRCFNIAGAVGHRGDHDTSRIIPAVLHAAASGEPLKVNGDGTAIRDYVHVADVADAYIAALDAARPGTHQAFNVGATQASVADIIRTAQDVTGKAVSVDNQPAAPEPQRLVADTSRARETLGWLPRRSAMPQIIADAWAAHSDITNRH